MRHVQLNIQGDHRALYQHRNPVAGDRHQRLRYSPSPAGTRHARPDRHYGAGTVPRAPEVIAPEFVAGARPATWPVVRKYLSVAYRALLLRPGVAGVRRQIVRSRSTCSEAPRAQMLINGMSSLAGAERG